MIGICILSNIVLRREGDSKSEIISEVLFGETFSVIEELNGWTKVTLNDDQYTGWINSKQFEILQTAVQHKQIAALYPYLSAVITNGKIMIPAGSNLPDLADNKFVINKTVYSLAESNPVHNTGNIIEIAEQYLNVPYLWGGKTPFGIDCSGFTQVVFRQCGIQLPRDAYQQAESGSIVSFREQVKAGDLAFFDNDEGRITHVGIMIDTNTIIHASGRVRIDTMDNFGIMNKEINQYSHKLRVIKRYF